jgi:omega-amidase
VHRYDKMHLFRPAGDHRYFTPGTAAGTFDARVGGKRLRCGVVICYDLRFPELVRSLAARGMDILFVPARWPAVRDEAWRTLLQARAIENQVFVVGCNAGGDEGGSSYVFGPGGECLIRTGRRAARRVEFVDLDLRLREKARKLYRTIDEAVYLRSIRLPSRIRLRR